MILRHSMICTVVIGIAAGSGSSGSLVQAQDFYLHNGDRVTFYGDSITAQRYYTRDIQDFTETRYPTLRVEYHNAGVPGDKVTGGYAGDAVTRVTRDVKPWRPSVVTVMLGMNDGDYVSPDPKILADYERGYAKLLDMLRTAASGARITMIENTPYDEITHGTEFAGYMATTEQNAEASRVLAQGEGLPVIDDYTPVKKLLERAKAVNPSFASMLVIGRIHPSQPVHWIMAESVMKAWHVDPVVSAVTLSAGTHDVTQSLRTRISGVTNAGTTLEWDQLDEALPLPFDLDSPPMNFVLDISDLASQDQEILKVTGLSPGRYSLTIDKMKIGVFTSEELAGGVNLALFKTPMWQQAREYDGAVEQRSTLEDADFHLFADTEVREKATASRVLREGEAEFEKKAEAALLIGPHHYSLKPVGFGSID